MIFLVALTVAFFVAAGRHALHSDCRIFQDKEQPAMSFTYNDLLDAIPEFDLDRADQFTPNEDRYSPVFPRLTDDDAPEGE